MTPAARGLMQKLLMSDEGFRGKPYTDTTGHMTIGFGRNLTDRPISTDEALVMLNNDLMYFENALLKNLSWFNLLDDNRKIALVDICFNVGLFGFLKFTTLFELMEQHKYDDAATDLLTTEAAKELPHRYDRICDIIRTGNIVL